MSWSITRCSFLHSNKTPPTPTSQHPAHPISSPSTTSPSANRGNHTNTGSNANHQLLIWSIANGGVPWRCVTDEMKMVCARIGCLWWKSSVLKTRDCYPYYHAHGHDLVHTGDISHTSPSRRAWPGVKHFTLMKSLYDNNSLLVGWLSLLNWLCLYWSCNLWHDPRVHSI